MLSITPNLSIDDSEIQEAFVRASGPGGQNVNKVATAVQLFFDIPNSSLPAPMKARLLRLVANRVSAAGVLTIEAKRFRTQEQNREDARQRLIDLIRQAVVPPKPRRATKPTRASKERRLESKKRDSQIKKNRRAAPSTD